MRLNRDSRLYPDYAPLIIAANKELISQRGRSINPALSTISAKQMPDFESGDTLVRIDEEDLHDNASHALIRQNLQKDHHVSNSSVSQNGAWMNG